MKQRTLAQEVEYFHNLQEQVLEKDKKMKQLPGDNPERKRWTVRINARKKDFGKLFAEIEAKGLNQERATRLHSILDPLMND